MGYLAKIFNDDWLADYGFLTVQADLLVGEVAAHVRAVAADRGGEPVSAAMAALEKADAAVVLDDGKPRGVITRQDVLGFLAAR